jgi:cytochrome c oxidase subunit 2
MIEALYTNAWGAFFFLLMLQIPFLIIFFHIVNKKAFVDPEPAKTSPEKYSKYRYAWIVVAIGIFIVVNAASIDYMPTIVEARAASAPNVQDVNVTARAWAFEFSDTEFKVGDTIRIKAQSVDTVHSFALYHPEGDLLFTMMLMPGTGTDSAVVHTFDEPGEYTVRCLEFCGIAHHNMKSTFTVL